MKAEENIMPADLIEAIDQMIAVIEDTTLILADLPLGDLDDNSPLVSSEVHH